MKKRKSKKNEQSISLDDMANIWADAISELDPKKSGHNIIIIEQPGYWPFNTPIAKCINCGQQKEHYGMPDYRKVFKPCLTDNELSIKNIIE